MDDRLIRQLQSFERDVLDFVDNKWPEEKKRFMMSLGLKYEGNVKRFTPVDSGRTRASIHTQLRDRDSVEVGSNVEWIEWLENGHTQKARFLPARYMSGRYRISRTRSGSRSLGGVMLREKFIPGAHMFEKAMQLYQVESPEMINDWLRQMWNLIRGGES